MCRRLVPRALAARTVPSRLPDPNQFSGAARSDPGFLCGCGGVVCLLPRAHGSLLILSLAAVCSRPSVPPHRSTFQMVAKVLSAAALFLTPTTPCGLHRRRKPARKGAKKVVPRSRR